MGTPKTSIAAVFSLVFGILLCLPGSGLLAAILGVVGISATKNNQRGGRGMAIAGLLLGLLGIVGWGVFGSIFYLGYSKVVKDTKPTRDQFIHALADRQVDAAQALCTADVSHEELQKISDRLQSAGALQDITGAGFNINKTNGQSITQVVAVATFAKEQHQFLLVVDKATGVWKVKEVHLDPKQNAGSGSFNSP